MYVGMFVGFIIKIGGKIILYVGDISLFSDMKMIGDCYQIDVVFLLIGGYFIMGLEDVL